MKKLFILKPLLQMIPPRNAILIPLLFSFSPLFAQSIPTSTGINSPTVSAISTPVGKKKVAHFVFNPEVETRRLDMKGAHEDEEADFGKPPRPPDPVNFEIKPGDGCAYLTWNKLGNVLSRNEALQMLKNLSYIVSVCKDGKSYEKCFDTPIKGTSVTIGNLKNEKNYYFTIVAVSKEGRRSYGLYQNVTPMAKP